jgi:hypothetical protein
MNRKDQLREIPYPVEQGESDQDKWDYDLVLEVAEHWETRPKTREEAEKMSWSLPRHLKWAHDRGEIRHGMLKYVYGQLRAMETEDQPISPGSAA